MRKKMTVALKFLIFTLLLLTVSGFRSLQKPFQILDDLEPLNTRPIIGVLTQPVTGDPSRPAGTTSIAATYIKNIESVGGSVVPVHYTDSFDDVYQLMQKINGIFFTGGDLDLVDPKTGEFHPYTKLANFIYETAIELNEKGVYFPLWGTCQGHQLMMMLESKNPFMIEPSKRLYEADPLIFAFRDQNRTRMYRNMPDDLIYAAQTEPLTYNIHNLGIHLDSFLHNQNLAANYTILSTNIGMIFFERLQNYLNHKFGFRLVHF